MATRFQALDITEDGELWRVIAFNVGIEIGQLGAVAAFALLLWLVVWFIEADQYARPRN